MNEPRRYNMEDLEDTRRWFREMEGYLKVCNRGKGFITDGTDREGRKFALEGFYQLKKELCLEEEGVPKTP